MGYSRLSTVKISCEFFPVATPPAREKLKQVRRDLASLNCEYFSVTYGAGGSTQKHTLSLVDEIQAEKSSPVMPHLTCVASDKDKIDDLLRVYAQKGIERIMALRGDTPFGYLSETSIRSAQDLIEYIRHKWGDWPSIYVAAYPEMHPRATSFSADIDNFVNKCRVGANGAVTQYFFNADAYFSFVETVRNRGIDLPITPGIMPISNYPQLARFSDACGAEIPRWIRKKLESYQNDLSSLRDFGTDVVANLCDQLLSGGVSSLHFYSMNRSDPILAVAKRLNLIAP